ncbi:FAD-dependent monooxygenase [Rhodococcus sp. Q1]|uniref:FAD-dependent monooxygenase n=1 Tax=Rhodococcus sp. Q1 TaxID=2508718 RepID=UPI001A9215DD|nr:FAD-dependent monooxygenase [Rhodococcus sp. Q1]
MVAAHGPGRPALNRVDILVVGAGPVGAAVALHAHRHGAGVCVAERRTELQRPSRSMLLWSRTLESLHRLGVVHELESRSLARLRTQLHLGERTVDVALADFAVPDRFRQPLMVRQAFLESALHRAVADGGVPLLTGAELDGLWNDRDGVLARLRTRGGHRYVHCRFLVGCDGADSTVRRSIRIPWHGHTYREEAVLADLDLEDLSPTTAHIGAGPAGIGFLFPEGEHEARWRLVATRAATGDDVPPGRDGPPVSVSEIRTVLEGANLPGRVGAAAWSTRVRLQRARAARFRSGPVFLAGDAAHVFSPAGAQGVNTGLQDAANLGWKLAVACGGSTDPERLLASYDAERRPVADKVGTLTELILHAEGDSRLPFRFLRTAVLPAVAPAVPTLLRLHLLTATAGATLSQDWVSYRAGPITEGHRCRGAGRLQAGDPLPDIEVVTRGRARRVHDLTCSPGMHVLHGPATLLHPVSGTVPVTCHPIDTWPPRRILAVRPDGYIGYRDDSGDPSSLDRWLRTVTGTAEPAGAGRPGR